MLGVVNMTEGETKKIMQPAESLLRTVHGPSKKFIAEILRLPCKFGGYREKDLYRLIIIRQGEVVVNALRNDDNTGMKVMILLEKKHLESGSGTSI